MSQQPGPWIPFGLIVDWMSKIRVSLMTPQNRTARVFQLRRDGLATQTYSLSVIEGRVRRAAFELVSEQITDVLLALGETVPPPP